MPVQDQNKEYQQNLSKWRLVRDCAEGSQKVKEARRIDNATSTAIGSEPGTLYLPAPNPTDNSIENRYRYIAYRTRANFVNFVAHTKDALLGMVCRKDPVIELPPTIAGMEWDANGQGESLESVMKRSVDEVLLTGRQGLLCDYPILPEGLTLAQTINYLPYLRYYNAESIINWRTEYIDGQLALALVVLQEDVNYYEDMFSATCKKQYRVLRLNDDGVYVQNLFNEDGDILVDEDGNADIIPRKGDGSLWYEIPFVFIGSVNNDPMPDKSPLYDLAEVNIAHYRNSADYEESCFLVGQPTPVLAGLTQAWVDDVLKGRVELGSRGAIPLPEGGSATLLQANPNQMPLEGMRNKEQQMVTIGAKIISDGGQAETAEAAKIRFAGQNSKLATIVGNVEEAHEKALEWALEFQGGEGDIEVELNKDFYDKSVDPNLLMAKIQLLDRGVIAVSDVREHLKKLGELNSERSDADIENEAGEVVLFDMLSGQQ